MTCSPTWKRALSDYGDQGPDKRLAEEAENGDENQVPDMITVLRFRSAADYFRVDRHWVLYKEDLSQPPRKLSAGF